MEFNGLVDNRVFMIVPESGADGHRIFNSRFVDEIKHAGTAAAFAKSRPVAQDFNDCNEEIMTNAPTVQRASQHLLLALFALWTMFVISCATFSRHIRRPKLVYNARWTFDQ